MKTMLMQNFGGQTQSILVFLKVTPYCLFARYTRVIKLFVLLVFEKKILVVIFSNLHSKSCTFFRERAKTVEDNKTKHS